MATVPVTLKGSIVVPDPVPGPVGPRGPAGPIGPAGPKGATGSPGPDLTARLAALEARVLAIESSSPVYVPKPPGPTQVYTDYTYVSGSLQTFLDGVPSGSAANISRAIFPNTGDHSISSRLTINNKSYIHVYGCTPTAALGAYDGALARCKITNTGDGSGLDSSVFAIANDNACNNISIIGFELIGSNSAAGTSGAYVTGGFESGHGVSVWAKSGSHHIRVAYNHMRNLFGHGVYIRSNVGDTAPDQIDVDHNRIRLTGVMGVAIANGTQVRIEDNLIEDIALYPVDLEDGDTGQVYTNVYIRRNQITRWTWTNVGIYQGYYAIAHAPGHDDGTITDYLFIQDNVLSGGRQNNTGSPFGHLIELVQSGTQRNVTVSGNTCSVSFDGPQMYFDHIDGLVIRDNVFNPAAGGATDYIATLASCTGTTVSGNTPSGTN